MIQNEEYLNTKEESDASSPKPLIHICRPVGLKHPVRDKPRKMSANTIGDLESQEEDDVGTEKQSGCLNMQGGEV